MSPPLRPKETQERLWRGLAFNDLQAISTDHCPFCMKEQKTIGRRTTSRRSRTARRAIETRMSLVYDGGVRPGRISLNRFVGADRDVAREDLRSLPAEGQRSRPAPTPTS